MSLSPAHLPDVGFPELGIPMLERVQALGVRYSFERSLKISRQGLLPKRFLAGFKAQALMGRTQEKVMPICEALGMPEGLLQPFAAGLRRASYIHFGFEQTRCRVLYKAYLEFYEAFQHRLRQPGPKPDRFPIHLGFKWDPQDLGRQVITRYQWLPFIPAGKIRARLAVALTPADLFVTEAALAVLDLCVRRIPGHTIPYMEVEEDGTPRRSFDLGLNAAGLRVVDLLPILSKASAGFGIAKQDLDTVLSIRGEDRAGHLAGGIDRQDRGFLTLYHGLTYLGGPGSA